MNGDAGDKLGEEHQPNDRKDDAHERADHIDDEIHTHSFTLRGRPRLRTGAGESALSTGTMGGNVETGPNRLHCSLKKKSARSLTCSLLGCLVMGLPRE